MCARHLRYDLVLVFVALLLVLELGLPELCLLDGRRRLCNYTLLLHHILTITALCFHGEAHFVHLLALLARPLSGDVLLHCSRVNPHEISIFFACIVQEFLPNNRIHCELVQLTVL